MAENTSGYFAQLIGEFVLEELGLDMWLSQGLMVSINGNKVSEDEPVSDGDEIALLPPVSAVNSRLIDKAGVIGTLEGIHEVRTI